MNHGHELRRGNDDGRGVEGNKVGKNMTTNSIIGKIY